MDRISGNGPRVRNPSTPLPLLFPPPRRFRPGCDAGSIVFYRTALLKYTGKPIFQVQLRYFFIYSFLFLNFSSGGVPGFAHPALPADGKYRHRSVPGPAITSAENRTLRIFAPFSVAPLPHQKKREIPTSRYPPLTEESPPALPFPRHNPARKRISRLMNSVEESTTGAISRSAAMNLSPASSSRALSFCWKSY